MSKITDFLDFVGKNNRRNIIFSLCFSLIIVLLFLAILFIAIVYKKVDNLILFLCLVAIGIIMLSAIINLFVWIAIERQGEEITNQIKEQKDEIERLKEKLSFLKG
ncbi:MAG: hypothetical protein AB1630_04620 [bacterium]